MKKAFYFLVIDFRLILNWYQRFRTKIWIENSALNLNFRLDALITTCLLISWIWFRAMFLIILSEIEFFAIYGCNKSRWFFPFLPPKRRHLLAVAWVDWKKNCYIFASFAKKNRNDCTFFRLLLTINWDVCSFPQLFLAIN